MNKTRDCRYLVVLTDNIYDAYILCIKPLYTFLVLYILYIFMHKYIYDFLYILCIRLFPLCYAVYVYAYIPAVNNAANL